MNNRPTITARADVDRITEGPLASITMTMTPGVSVVAEFELGDHAEALAALRYCVAEVEAQIDAARALAVTK